MRDHGWSFKSQSFVRLSEEDKLMDQSTVAAVLYGGGPEQPAPPPAAPQPPSSPKAETAPVSQPTAPAKSAGEVLYPDTKMPSEYSLQLPEGSQLDAKAAERTATLAAELGLSQDHAQKALEFASGEVKAYHQQLQAQNEKLRTETWPAAVQADPELGGANLQATLADVAAGRQAAIDAGVWTPALCEYLDKSGLGSHPEAVRLLSWVGRVTRGQTIPRPLAG